MIEKCRGAGRVALEVEKITVQRVLEVVRVVGWVMVPEDSGVGAADSSWTSKML